MKFSITRFFYKQHFYKQRLAEIGKNLSNTLRLNICYLKIIHILHPRKHPNIKGSTRKNKQKNKCVCIHDIMRLIIIKMEKKKKNRSHRYDINRPRSRHRHKDRKHIKCLIMIMLIGTKQHLNNI